MRVRRGLWLTGGFLLIGSALTIAAAWGSAAVVSLEMVSGQGARPPGAKPGGFGWGAPEHLDWPVPVPGDWPRPRMVHWSVAPGVRWDRGVTPDALNSVLFPGEVLREASGASFGFPFRSMSWRRLVVFDHAGGVVSEDGGGIVLPPRFGRFSDWGVGGSPHWRRLPLVPRVGAFAADTAIFGAAAACVYAAVVMPLGWARQRTRLRRGQCVRCAYPIGAAGVCPECGSRPQQLKRASGQEASSLG